MHSPPAASPWQTERVPGFTAGREADRAHQTSSHSHVAAVFCGAWWAVMMARMPRSMLLCATPHAVADDDGGGQNGIVGGFVLLVRL